MKALELANPEQKAILEELFARPTEDFQQKYNTVRGIFDTLQVKAQTEDLIVQYSEQAMQDLEKVSVDDGKKLPFREMIQKLVNRDK